MIEQWLSDPSKVGATALLLAAIAAFYKVLILPRQTHVEAIAQIVNSHKEAVERLEADIKREREENERLRALLNRNVDVVDKSLNALQAAQHAFEKSYEVRSIMFQPEKAKESGT